MLPFTAVYGIGPITSMTWTQRAWIFSPVSRTFEIWS